MNNKAFKLKKYRRIFFNKIFDDIDIMYDEVLSMNGSTDKIKNMISNIKLDIQILFTQIVELEDMIG